MKKNIRITDAGELPAVFADALAHWRKEALEIWNSDRIRWYAKLASTAFSYGGKNYVVVPEDVYPAEYFEKYPEGSIHAGFELLQHTIEEDLLLSGAENIHHYGFLD